MKTSEKIEMLAAAMSKAQGAMEAARKDSKNPNFNSRYADLASLWSAAREPLAANGLSVWQEATYSEGVASVTTRIVHSSGEWVEHGPLGVPLTKHKFKTATGDYEMVWDAHGVGAASTYAKRIAFGAAMGIVADGEDDDGNTASGRREASEPVPDRTMPFYDLRCAVKTAGQEIETKCGGIWHEHVRLASKFDKDGKPQAFGDPFNPAVGEKWLKLTQKNLAERLIEIAKTDAAAAEAADLFGAKPEEVPA